MIVSWDAEYSNELNNYFYDKILNSIIIYTIFKY